ncbi:predicted protein [Chaetomium globosum CBS 148.51]|uniref:Uncharacterized protein n=1 Tax=Chaetomium globosum (strain ATCC 6205 / CBS 148.51 / DSM 1962 / NBRC 6347 / NRRL 1970) TaxID=306901 RepID=Q2H3I8_CHAGB|nr:uncharacterized protein CHGG_06777 [Chaetomium globosum CBS 148.51]EAQ90158.1 predicted protein [Chaetomium globosum CBS 148.51]
MEGREAARPTGAAEREGWDDLSGQVGQGGEGGGQRADTMGGWDPELQGRRGRVERARSRSRSPAVPLSQGLQLAGSQQPSGFRKPRDTCRL